MVTAARRVPGVVQLLGVSEHSPLLVLGDIGREATVADRLLGRDSGAAERAVYEWVRTVAGLQAATWDARPAFSDALQRISSDTEPVVDSMPSLTAESVGMLQRLLPALGLEARVGALEQLAAIPRRLDVTQKEAPGALVPGDTCPDNAAEQRGGLVLLDFESADYHHVAWEAAYPLVPWPTCWCSWRLPQDVQDRALYEWRETLRTAFPFVDSAHFKVDLAYAVVCWALISATWDLRPVLSGDLASPTPERVLRRRATTPPPGRLQRLPRLCDRCSRVTAPGGRHNGIRQGVYRLDHVTEAVPKVIEFASVHAAHRGIGDVPGDAQERRHRIGNPRPLHEP